MAPIHHHFELCGWSETRVVAVFTVITALLCLAGLLVLSKTELQGDIRDGFSQETSPCVRHRAEWYQGCKAFGKCTGRPNTL